jgi:hypothetical protein
MKGESLHRVLRQKEEVIKVMEPIGANDPYLPSSSAEDLASIQSDDQQKPVLEKGKGPREADEPTKAENTTGSDSSSLAVIGQYAEQGPSSMAGPSSPLSPTKFFPRILRKPDPQQQQLPPGINTAQPNRALRGTPVNDTVYIRPKREDSSDSESSTGSLGSHQEPHASLETIPDPKGHTEADPARLLGGKDIAYKSVIADMAAKNRNERRLFPETRAKLALLAHAGTFSGSRAIDKLSQSSQRETDPNVQKDEGRNNRNLRQRELNELARKQTNLSSDSDS